MKTWMMALALVAMLGMTALADAKGTGKHKGNGTYGKIDSVTSTGFTMTTGGKKNPHVVTVTLGSATVTVDGVAGGKIEQSMVGKHCSVVGTATGDTIAATEVKVHTKARHHKAKDAA